MLNYVFESKTNKSLKQRHPRVKNSTLKTRDTVLCMNNSDKKLIERTELLAQQERRISSEILECLHEIESRMIYAELAYSSLYEFCIKQLKYSEGAAHRRIAAMRLLKGLPENTRGEITEKIQLGSLSITNLSILHSFLKLEKKEQGKTYTAEEKTILLGNAENKSKREVEKELASIQPKIIPQESTRVITESLTEIKFVADEKLMQKFQRVKEVSSHALPNASMAEIISWLAEEYLKRHDPMVKIQKLLTSPATKLRVISNEPVI